MLEVSLFHGRLMTLAKVPRSFVDLDRIRSDRHYFGGSGSGSASRAFRFGSVSISTNVRLNLRFSEYFDILFKLLKVLTPMTPIRKIKQCKLVLL
jgi:hypothetical protein